MPTSGSELPLSILFPDVRRISGDSHVALRTSGLSSQS